MRLPYSWAERRIHRIAELPRRHPRYQTGARQLRLVLSGDALVVCTGARGRLPAPRFAIASAIIAAMGEWSTALFPVLGFLAIGLNLLFSLSILAVLFGMLMRWLPTQRQPWRSVWGGAVLASVLLEIGKELLGLYLGRAAFADAFRRRGRAGRARDVDLLRAAGVFVRRGVQRSQGEENLRRYRTLIPLPRRHVCVDSCVGVAHGYQPFPGPRLIERAVEVSGERTKKAAVTRALEEFIAGRSQKRLVELMDKLEWDKSFDYKSESSRR